MLFGPTFHLWKMFVPYASAACFAFTFARWRHSTEYDNRRCNYRIWMKQWSKPVAQSSVVSGPDNIGPHMLKEIAPTIMQPLLHIINLSFSTGIIHNNLKVARVIRVYKKRWCVTYTELSAHYHFLSVFHKILEKLMAKRITDFLTANFVLYIYQFWFTKNYSTVLALIDALDDIYCQFAI